MINLNLKTSKQAKGKEGEQRAAAFLKNNGYEILELNYKIREAEIDIIAWHDKYHFGKTLCFVEVKARSKKDGSAERSVDAPKIKKIFKAAEKFCEENKIDREQIPIQFEQVSVYGNEIRHYIIPVN